MRKCTKQEVLGGKILYTTPPHGQKGGRGVGYDFSLEALMMINTMRLKVKIDMTIAATSISIDQIQA